MKETHGGTITVVSMGKAPSKRVLDQAVAAGADELVLLQDDAFEDLDSYTTSSCLAAQSGKEEPTTLSSAEEQAADSNSGQVGFGIAEFLDIPCVALVKSFEFAERKLN